MGFNNNNNNNNKNKDLEMFTLKHEFLFCFVNGVLHG